jgi:hypothetical protein
MLRIAVARTVGRKDPLRCMKGSTITSTVLQRSLHRNLLVESRYIRQIEGLSMGGKRFASTQVKKDKTFEFGPSKYFL